MKKVLISLIIVAFISSANMFAMDKLTQAERAKVITAAKAAKGDEQKFAAAIKSIPKAAGITLADAIPAVQAKGEVTTGGETGEVVVVVVPEPGPIKIVTNAQKEQLIKEYKNLLEQMRNLSIRRQELAKSFGNREDAQDFWDYIENRFNDVATEVGEAPELDFSTLQFKVMPNAPQ